MILLENINEVLTLEKAHQKDGRSLLPSDSSILKNTSIIFGEKIEFVGPKEDIPKSLSEKISKVIDLNGHVVTPELVDCHTHLIFGGNRAFEYTLRLDGADYQEIAKSGGGIIESSRGTNSLTDEELFNLSCKKIERINSFGVGTIEIKSGYGLGFDEEYRLTKLIHKLKNKYAPKIIIKNTFMAAHAVPKNFNNSHEYIQKVCIPLLKKVSEEKLIDAVDIFHEVGYFDEKDVSELLKFAKSLSISVKTHADEFQDNKGAELAVSLEALSTDHLLCTGQKGIEALANSNTVATLLPGTGYFLGKPQADARKFLDAGVKVAIASDYNPGSCHCDNVLLVASLSAPNYKLNSTELWSSITLNAAHALDLKEQGALIPGLLPRFSIFKCESLSEITYSWGNNFAVNLDSIES